MKITPQNIKEWIEAGLHGSEATVDGDGRHFEAAVVCPGFHGKNSLARHRMVYAALGDHMRETVHALSLKTLTPVEAGVEHKMPEPKRGCDRSKNQNNSGDSL